MPTLTASPEIDAMTARDLSANVQARIATQVAAVDAIPRLEGTDDDRLLLAVADHLIQAQVALGKFHKATVAAASRATWASHHG